MSKKKNRYVAVYTDGRHIVTGLDLIKDFRVLDNGFMFRVGGRDYYTPYFFPHHNLQMAWKFAEGAKAEEERLGKKEEFADKCNECREHFPGCPDSL